MPVSPISSQTQYTTRIWKDSATSTEPESPKSPSKLFDDSIPGKISCSTETTSPLAEKFESTEDRIRRRPVSSLVKSEDIQKKPQVTGDSVQAPTNENAVSQTQSSKVLNQIALTLNKIAQEIYAYGKILISLLGVFKAFQFVLNQFGLMKTAD